MLKYTWGDVNVFSSEMTINIVKTFEQLTTPVWFYDAQGSCVLTNTPDTLPLPQLATMGEKAFELEQKAFLRIPQTGASFIAVQQAPGARALLELWSSVLDTLLRLCEAADGPMAFMRRVLLQELSDAEIAEVTTQNNIDPEMERCVLLFHSVRGIHAIRRALLELFDHEKDTFVVDLDNNNLALVKSMQQIQYMELKELTLAVFDTIREEESLSMMAGIGEPKKGLAPLALSLEEAKTALEIGKKYHENESVYMHKFLLLERLMQEIPAKVAQSYYERLFNRSTSRIFSEETIKTIETFFECHLNIAEAARRLYIHRNTLVYRLDKVQKATGLDLRTFEDAITFRLLYMLGKRAFMYEK